MSNLCGELERLGDLGEPLGVLALQVLEQAAALADLAEETLPGGEVLLVLEKVTGEVLDLGSEDGDLDLGGTRVLIVGLVLFDDALLLLLVEHIRHPHGAGYSRSS